MMFYVTFQLKWLKNGKNMHIKIYIIGMRASDFLTWPNINIFGWDQFYLTIFNKLHILCSLLLNICQSVGLMDVLQSYWPKFALVPIYIRLPK